MATIKGLTFWPILYAFKTYFAVFCRFIFCGHLRFPRDYRLCMF